MLNDQTLRFLAHHQRHKKQVPLLLSRLQNAERPPDTPEVLAAQPPEAQISAQERVKRLLECPAYTSLNLSRSEDAIYRACLELGIHYAGARGFSRATTTVTFHMPAELVMAFAGYRKSAFYLALRKLQEVRLMTVRGRTGTLRGQARKTGSMFCIKLDPRHTHITPRILPEDFQHPWRDLDADVQRGHTAYQELHGGSFSSEKKWDAETLVRLWALPCSQPSDDALSLTLQRSDKPALEVFDLPTLREARQHDCAPLIERLAKGVAAKLQDLHSVPFYCKVFWQVLRLLDAGLDRVGYLQSSIQRAQIALQEHAVRRTAGARLVDDWKRSGFWEELGSASQAPVALRRMSV